MAPYLHQITKLGEKTTERTTPPAPTHAPENESSLHPDGGNDLRQRGTQHLRWDGAVLFDVLHLVRVLPGFVQDPEDHVYNLKTREWAAEKKSLVTLIAALIGAVRGSSPCGRALC